MKLILSFQICCFFFLNLVFGSNLLVTLFAFKIWFEHSLSISLFGFYIFISFFVYIFMFIIWVIIILICYWCCCCCFCCWSFCQCIIDTICCCSPDIGLWLMARSKVKFMFLRGWLTFPHLVRHSPHLEQTEAVGHVRTNIVLPGCCFFFMCLWESIYTQYCFNDHIFYGLWVYYCL